MQNQETADFLANIEWLIDFDSISPQYNNVIIENIQKNIEKFGKRAELVIEQNGGLMRIRENGRTSKFNRENILREIRDMWNASAIDADTGALQIAENAILQIENKNWWDCSKRIGYNGIIKQNMIIKWKTKMYKIEINFGGILGKKVYRFPTLDKAQNFYNFDL